MGRHTDRPLGSECMNEENAKVSYSAIQPSGDITLGNYLGALRNWVLMQNDYKCFYCVADLHAITVRQKPSELRRRTLDVLAILLAVGIDPERSVLYMQSQVPEHTELSWILTCHTYMGELSRMTQFKDKSSKQSSIGVGAGLFTYPDLMAADILLYHADYVPVGVDQKQHVELARDIAERMNSLYGDLFTVPEPVIRDRGARIASLQDPTRKMSKSDENPNAYITILDPPDVIERKIKRAVTDSDGEIRFDEENKPGVSNLLTIYSVLTNCTADEAAASLAGQGYGALKKAVTEAILECLAPFQERYRKIRADSDYLTEVMRTGASRASEVAGKTLAKVHRKVGLAPRRA